MAPPCGELGESVVRIRPFVLDRDAAVEAHSLERSAQAHDIEVAFAGPHGARSSQESSAQPASDGSFAHCREATVLQMDMGETVPQRQCEHVWALSCHERVARVETCLQAKRANRGHDVRRARESLIPVILDRDAHAGAGETIQVDSEVRHCAHDDQVDLERAGQLERPRGRLVARRIEPAGADGAHANTDVVYGTHSLGHVTRGVPEPDLDVLEAECGETFECALQRQGAECVRVAGEPHVTSRIGRVGRPRIGLSTPPLAMSTAPKHGREECGRSAEERIDDRRDGAIEPRRDSCEKRHPLMVVRFDFLERLDRVQDH